MTSIYDTAESIISGRYSISSYIPLNVLKDRATDSERNAIADIESFDRDFHFPKWLEEPYMKGNFELLARDCEPGACKIEDVWYLYTNTHVRYSIDHKECLYDIDFFIPYMEVPYKYIIDIRVLVGNKKIRLTFGSRPNLALTRTDSAITVQSVIEVVMYVLDRMSSCASYSDDMLYIDRYIVEIIEKADDNTGFEITKFSLLSHSVTFREGGYK